MSIQITGSGFYLPPYIENSKTRILCTLFKQPLDDTKILAGIFTKNGDILELFESN